YRPTCGGLGKSRPTPAVNEPGAYTAVEPRGRTAVPNLVCTGATLKCSFGTAPATFSATPGRVSAGAAAGVVSDTTTSNVPPFGNCTSLRNPAVNTATQAAGGTLAPQPCQPVVLRDWSPGAARVKAGPAAAL